MKPATVLACVVAGYVIVAMIEKRADLWSISTKVSQAAYQKNFDARVSGKNQE